MEGRITQQSARLQRTIAALSASMVLGRHRNRGAFEYEQKGLLLTKSAPMQSLQSHQSVILHVSRREMLLPLRDKVLRVAGFQVDSTLNADEALSLFSTRHYDLVLIDVEGEDGIPHAEQLCSNIKTALHDQLVAFVCNWRVAILTDCPDEIVRTEFNPEAFVAGVRSILARN
jgi:hypothetical protein